MYVTEWLHYLITLSGSEHDSFFFCFLNNISSIFEDYVKGYCLWSPNHTISQWRMLSVVKFKYSAEYYSLHPTRYINSSQHVWKHLKTMRLLFKFVKNKLQTVLHHNSRIVT